MRSARAGVRRLRARYRALSGWRLHGVLFGLGLLGVLGHAPAFIFPLYVVALTGLVLALDDARRTLRPVRAGFARAWSFAAGHFLGGTAWVANAFLVSAGDHAWLIWAPLIVLPGGLALFWGLAGALYTRFAPRHAGRIALFMVVWMGVEILRSTLLSGFPWNLPGHVFQAGGALSQVAAIFGAYGLSGLALYAAAAPAALWGADRRPVRITPMLFAAILLLTGWAYGHTRLQHTVIKENDFHVQIVQIYLPQAEKRFAQRYEILDQYLSLSSQNGTVTADTVIWPEGAIPAFLLNSPDLLAELSAHFPEGSRLITGTPRMDLGPDQRPTAYYNALVSLVFQDEEPRIEAQYDKARLVPFGESNPLRPLTRWIGFETLVEAAPAYDPGPGAQTLRLQGLPEFAPLICYEAIYPRFIPRQDNRPQWILNISNDSWYGNSSGPQQLMNQTQYRSIEEGLPLIRVAAAGVSGQVDPLGRVIESLPSDATETLTITLREALDAPPYARYGNALWVIALIILAALTQILVVVLRTHLGGAFSLHEGR